MDGREKNNCDSTSWMSVLIILGTLMTSFDNYYASFVNMRLMISSFFGSNSRDTQYFFNFEVRYFL